ncbi:MAG: hypothetical protein KAR20_00540 [Candidatus Heimdallarchaeota archaeon]|nr:hypothetical protein [Candidatus Heimdallarchaeota archaeon]
MKPIDHLKQLIRDEFKRTHPNLPAHAIPVNLFNSYKPEKREKKRIEKFLNLSGWFATVVENQGTFIPAKIEKNVIGQYKQIGKDRFNYSPNLEGQADIRSTIKGRAVEWELKRKYKRGHDQQSAKQKRFQAKVERAGGIYIIVESFEDFYVKYNELIKEL